MTKLASSVGVDISPAVLYVSFLFSVAAKVAADCIPVVELSTCLTGFVTNTSSTVCVNADQIIKTYLAMELAGVLLNRFSICRFGQVD